MSRKPSSLFLNKGYQTKAVGILIIPFLASDLLIAQTSVSTRPSGNHQLYLDDQKDRGVGGTASPDVQTHDVQRLAQAKALLASGSLTTAEDFHDVAFIFQHSLKAEDYLVAHILAMEAVEKGDSRSKWIAAATLDRYLQAIGKPQIFGTQYTGTCNLNGTVCKETQEPYDDSIISDQIRKDFCVVDRATQQKNVEAITHNLPFVPIPPGCTR